MVEKTSEVNKKDLETVIDFTCGGNKTDQENPMFPWHIARAIQNRIDKKDAEEDNITVNNSHIRMILSGVYRMYDEEDIQDQIENSIARIKSELNQSD